VYNNSNFVCSAANIRSTGWLAMPQCMSTYKFATAATNAALGALISLWAFEAREFVCRSRAATGCAISGRKLFAN